MCVGSMIICSPSQGLVLKTLTPTVGLPMHEACRGAVKTDV